MINRAGDMLFEVQQNMRGGTGSIKLTALFEEHIPHVRLLKVIELVPGSSIGAHVHEQECEVFYALSGTATVLDDGVEKELHPGDAHLCRDGSTHSLLNKSQEVATVLAIIPTLAE